MMSERTNPDTKAELLPVTQQDREAAVVFMHKVRGFAVGLPSDGHPAIQAFTRHRIDSQAELVGVLENAKGCAQAFLDMVNVIQRVQALPIPAILETAQHNCPIILGQINAALARRGTPS